MSARRPPAAVALEESQRETRPEKEPRSWQRNLMDRWFEAHPRALTAPHLASFDYFVHTRLEATLRTMNDGFMVTKKVENSFLEVQVHVGGPTGQGFYFDRPTLADGKLMYPNNARLLNLTYASGLYTDVTLTYRKDGKVVGSREFPRARIGTLPIMLHSTLCVLHDQPPEVLHEMGECPFDQGGYFIVGGKEKVIIAQERIAYNRLFVSRVPRVPNASSAKAKYAFDAFIRCMSPREDLYPKLLRLKVFQPDHTRRNAIVAAMPHIEGDIPLLTLFRALGVESDEEAVQLILNGGQVDEAKGIVQPDAKQLLNFLRDTLVDGGKQRIFSQAAAWDLLTKRGGFKTAKQVQSFLVHRVLPNVGYRFEDKAVYLGYLVRRLVNVAIGVTPPTVRDSWVHKRMDLSGFLLADLFRDVYGRFRRNVLFRLDDELQTGPWKYQGNMEAIVNRSNFSRIFNASIIDRGMLQSLKGRWNVDESLPEGTPNAYSREGVVQDLNRQSYQTYMSHVRRVSTVMKQGLKLVAPHQLYSAQWGAVCPVDSPDGANVGILKHFTVLCHLTCDRDPAPLEAHLLRTDLVRAVRGASQQARLTQVFVNHSLLGTARQPARLVKYLRLLRRTGLLAADVSVTWDVFSWEIQILTDGGRTCRPLVAVDKLRDAMYDGLVQARPWAQLVAGTLVPETLDLFAGPVMQPADVLAAHAAVTAEDVDRVMEELEGYVGILELIDTEELQKSLVASTPSSIGPFHTHCEIHAAAMFSYLTASIPLLNHNHGAYNPLCIAQTKQGIGMYATNYLHRTDNAGMVLHSSQLPLVTTYFAQKLCDGKLTHGENLVIAIATYGGYNQEDAIILNQSSVERGMLNMSMFTTLEIDETTSIDGNAHQRVVFANPLQLLSAPPGGDDDGTKDDSPATEVSGLRPDTIDYATLGPEGLPTVGTRIRAGSAVAGMCVLKSASGADSAREQQQESRKVHDATQAADLTTWGTVDRVLVTEGAPGSRTAKVRLVDVRGPDIGDKMASRYGQKGVIGMLLPSHDMPFAQDGTVPDIIINPNGFPRRMTIAHLLEAILGRVACHAGRRVDATSFDGVDPVAAAKEYFMRLEPERSMTSLGDTVLYNGRTGQQMQSEVFVGVNYYNRLKHMVADKINHRLTGPRNAVTHQPTQGRGNAGGLKMGEMEQHCMLTHGAASFLKESFFDRSDPFHVKIDERTGHMATHGTQLPAGVSAAVRAPLPYSFKTMLQELEAMSINLKMHV